MGKRKYTGINTMKKQREKYDTTAIQWKHSRSLIILKRRDIVTASFSYFHIIMLSSGLFRARTHIYSILYTRIHTKTGTTHVHTNIQCVCVYVEWYTLSQFHSRCYCNTHHMANSTDWNITFVLRIILIAITTQILMKT